VIDTFRNWQLFKPVYCLLQSGEKLPSYTWQFYFSECRYWGNQKI